MKGIANTKLFQDPSISNDEKQDQLDGMTSLDKDLIGINIMDLNGNLRVAGVGYLNFKDDPFLWCSYQKCIRKGNEHALDCCKW